jgi:hypothetical protein
MITDVAGGRWLTLRIGGKTLLQLFFLDSEVWALDNMETWFISRKIAERRCEASY